MHYKITKSNIPHFFEIEITIKSTAEYIEIQLPAWRPGRYEIQNFAKNIQNFIVTNPEKEAINFTKTTKDCWRIQSDSQLITIKYNYFVDKQDAGNSYLNEEVFYINFINCLPYWVGKTQGEYKVEIAIPNGWQYTCALPITKLKNGNLLLTHTYNQIVDSPFFAGKLFQKKSYTVAKSIFNINIFGRYQPNWDKILPAFKAFTEFQICQMGDFPTKNYDFIIWILPKPNYHGVEHGASTMVVLGPDNEGDNLIFDLLGLCSHELFHAWNICKIRPKELLPYDFTKENYFDTGFVVEGVTTYLGDLFLLHSGVFSKEEYLKELTTTAMRHFIKDGNAKQSLTESSIDLWVDGYSAGIPNKKVSIYNKGAMVALILDLSIRLKHNHLKSLYSIMKEMWLKFGKKDIGYQMADYKQIAEKIYGETLNEYFEVCIYGNISLFLILNKLLKQFGLKMEQIRPDSLTIIEIANPTKKQLFNKNNFLKIHT